MTGITTLKVLTLITKLYTGYAYSLAFIFQSSLVLILAFISSAISMHLYRKMQNAKTVSSTKVQPKSQSLVREQPHIP